MEPSWTFDCLASLEWQSCFGMRPAFLARTRSQIQRLCTERPARRGDSGINRQYETYEPAQQGNEPGGVRSHWLQRECQLQNVGLLQNRSVRRRGLLLRRGADPLAPP